MQEIFGNPEELYQKDNLVEAIKAARQMAEENEGEPIFIACTGERNKYDEAPDMAVYRVPGDDLTCLAYARDLYTGKEHRRTATEVISIAASLAIPLVEDEADAILDEAEGEFEIPFEVTDRMLNRCITGEDGGPDESMDGDTATALASAGHGTDEDYAPSGNSGDDW